MPGFCWPASLLQHQCLAQNPALKSKGSSKTLKKYDWGMPPEPVQSAFPFASGHAYRTGHGRPAQSSQLGMHLSFEDPSRTQLPSRLCTGACFATSRDGGSTCGFCHGPQRMVPGLCWGCIPIAAAWVIIEAQTCLLLPQEGSDGTWRTALGKQSWDSWVGGGELYGKFYSLPKDSCKKVPQGLQSPRSL